MIFLFLLAAAPESSVGTPADALIDQLQNQREWSEADRLRAVDLAKLKSAAWGSCLEMAEQALGRSKEPVETVATAIVGTCLKPQHSYQTAYALALRGLSNAIERTQLAEKAIEARRSAAREAIVARLVAARLPPPNQK